MALPALVPNLPSDGATIWWPNLYLIQVIEAMPGSVVPLAMFCISFKYASSDLLQIGSKFGHQVTSLPKFEGCPPGWVTCIATLPWITLLTLSVSIKLVSLSARVTSVKFTLGVVLTHSLTDNSTHRSDRSRDLGPIKRSDGLRRCFSSKTTSSDYFEISLSQG